MIDIHAHILPGLDDGARHMDDSLAMAQLAIESGVHTIVATSHANTGGYFRQYKVEEYRECLHNFRYALKQEEIPLTVLSGMEIFMTDEVPELIEEQKLIPLNHSRYYLVEFAFGIEIEEMQWLLEQVMQLGVVPVIAHPERYHCIQRAPEAMKQLIRKGCMTQINRGSVFGRFGRRAQECADYLLDNQLVACIASDAHKPYERTTFMADIKEYMEDQYSVRYSKELLYDNCLRMIEDKKFYPWIFPKFMSEEIENR
ncbi:MAG: hypothetical protein Q4D45_00675 [Lachnospiraceae bacterium]|nr:hypothetical protein [Lachnospiraceae bacterium]